MTTSVLRVEAIAKHLAFFLLVTKFCYLGFNQDYLSSKEAPSIEIQKLMVRIADFYKLCNVTQVNYANFMVRVGSNVVIEQKRKLLV